MQQTAAGSQQPDCSCCHCSCSPLLLLQQQQAAGSCSWLPAAIAAAALCDALPRFALDFLLAWVLSESLCLLAWVLVSLVYAFSMGKVDIANRMLFKLYHCLVIQKVF